MGSGASWPGKDAVQDNSKKPKVDQKKTHEGGKNVG